MKKTVLIYRKDRANFKSIEKVFDAITQELLLDKVKLPQHSTSILNVLKNIFFLRNVESDIIHITGDAHYSILCLPKYKKVVLTIHDCVLLHRLSKYTLKYWVYYFFWYKLPMIRADVITTISEKTKQDLLKISEKITDKIKIIYNPIDNEFDKIEKGFNTAYPILLQVGTGFNKNLENIIHAIASIKCKLIIVGKLCRSQEQLLNQFHIDYDNFFDIDKSILIEKYIESDIVLFASTYEGFGLPILEAQSIGRVLITSKISPMIEIAGEGAYFVDPFDPNSIRKAILELLNNDSLREKLITHGYSNLIRFELSSIAQQYAAIYNYI
ncbi:glycosyltransferase family 4 protein [Tellurirhabdus bombi]|uniref:glycosyltransferase family 4 protein n=1 Tax=Tellurirhabdus bombi TaxID=2907205 RepID=UPI001F46930A|nr:glycosyltransferase family 1 protein [Tellurirhabdus bombi]